MVAPLDHARLVAQTGPEKGWKRQSAWEAWQHPRPGASHRNVGTVTTVLRNSRVSALCVDWALKEWFTAFFRDVFGETRTLAASVCAAGCVDCSALLVGGYPLDRVGISIALDDTGEYDGSAFGREMNFLARTYMEEGVVGGIYKGFGLACAHAFVYRATHLALLDRFRSAINEVDGFWRRVLLGHSLVAIAGLVAFPLGTVRKRLMVARLGKHRSTADCCRHIVRTEGIGSLYTGAGWGMATGLVGCIVYVGLAHLSQGYLRLRYPRRRT